MIVRPLHNTRVLYQTPQDEESGIPEPAIVLYMDSTPIICMSQEGRDINLNPESVPELVKVLKDLAKEATA
ncbi:MAG: hypothetical protein ABFE01_24145 [Phycisphaerales bacterium]